MKRVDVCVIGAGPAGCIAASELARAGLRVIVCEEHERIGMPVDCSGVIGTEAFERLELPRETVRDRLQSLDFVSPSGKRIVFDPQRILAYIVDRMEFDRSLAERVVAGGGRIQMATAVTSLKVDRDGVRLSLVNQKDKSTSGLWASAVVLAGGPRYQFQEQLGMGRPARYLRTLQAEVSLRMPGRPTIFLGSQVAPGSFAWWLPMKAGDGFIAKVGVSAITGSQQAFHVFADALQHLGYLERNSLVPRAWMIPITPIRRTFSDRVVAVGDAAGQTKPTTGGGLYYGLLCAKTAAEVLIEGCRTGDLSARFLARYEQRWRRLLSRELRTAARFRRVLERFSDQEIDCVFDMISQDGFLPRLTQEVQFDWHRPAILQTLHWPPLARMMVRHMVGSQLARLVT